MNEPEIEPRPAEPPPQITLSVTQLQQLHAAGRWSRFVGVVSVGAGVLSLGIAAAMMSSPRTITSFASQLGASVPYMVLLVLSSLGVGGLLWAYGQSVAAYFRRDADALIRGFRQLRYFFVLFTCLSAVMAIIELLGTWRKL